MAGALLVRLLIAAATVGGAVTCVWLTNSILPILAVALVVYLASMLQRTDDGQALQRAEGQSGAQRRTRRRDDS